MSISIRLPALAEGAASTLVRYLRRPGDGIDYNDPVALVDIGNQRLITVHSPYDGLLLKHYRHPGQPLSSASPLAELSTAAAPYSNKIFVSYRWNDEPHFAGRLYERLRNEFGRFQVFLDNESLRAGGNIDVQIDTALKHTEVFVVILGANWLDSRLNDPTDRHRREIETALARGVVVLPVLVGVAGMPSADNLPPPIRALTSFVALRITHDMWDVSIHKVIAPIAETLDINGSRHASQWNLPNL